MSDSPARALDPAAGTTAPADPADPDATAREGPGAAAALPPAVPPAPPGFDLLAEVGRGGMGVVWRAWDRALGREVAVKLLGDRAATADAAARFAEEARITARLQHPGIPAVYQVGELADGRPFLAMKLIDGDTLEALLRAGWPVDVPAVFERVCEAVGYAHSQGIVHRDLKPGNVMVGRFGEVQVMDWGLAKPAAGREPPAGPAAWGPGGDLLVPGADTPFTLPGSVLGTPAYMAPEQAAGGRYDARSDVFGLGAVLCALLTGRPPFAAPGAVAAWDAAAAGDTADALRRLDACGADPGLVGLCKRCLSVDPHERPADGAAAAAAAAELRQAADARARRAETAAAEERTRRRLQLRLGGLAAAALLAGLAGTAVGLVQARRERAAAEARERETAGVLRFVEGHVFAAARPAGMRGGLGKDVTLRAALTASLAAVADGFPGQPLVEARLRTQLGITFMDLGEPAAALDQFAAAKRLTDPVLDPDHPDALEAANNIAYALIDLGREAEAVVISEGVLARRRAVLGPDHRDTLVTAGNLANCYAAVGQRDEALRLDEDTLARRRAALGPDDEHTLMSMNNLSNRYADAGRMDRCLQLTVECLAGRRRVLGETHPHTLTTLNNLGETYTDLGEHGNALGVHEEAVARRLGLLGPDHRDTLYSRWRLAAALAAVGRGAEAVPVADDTLRRAAGRAVDRVLLPGLVTLRLRHRPPAVGWLAETVAAWPAPARPR